MNLVAMNKAIAIANRMTRLMMTRYQTKVTHEPLVFGSLIASTEAELVTKNNLACFAGYVAISPEFNSDGGTRSLSGAPIFYVEDGDKLLTYKASKAIAAWLDVETIHANNLVYGIETGRPAIALPDYISPYYGKKMKEVTKANVVTKLQALITDYPSSVFEG